MSNYWLNKVFYDTQNPATLAEYHADPAAFLNRYELAPASRDAVLRTDIGAMFEAGANPYLLRFFCVNLGVREPDYLAALHQIGTHQIEAH